ncbi:peptidylprolyl isomerase [Cellulomonas marina]|uniref:peptidylprolyl isomerase n=1 Tax=Cellulomonas marina TaxID=988821 RepID=A0A1I0ZST8_9CELL|nr:peptidylprolyl isomerase [Cellulomonas marina]
MRAVAGLAAALLAVGSLAACTADEEPVPDPEVTVQGLPGERPTLVYDTPLVVPRTLRETVWPGSGDPVATGDTVLLDYLLQDARTGAVLADTWSGTPEVRTVSPEELGADLARTLTGAAPGARLLQVGAGTVGATAAAGGGDPAATPGATSAATGAAGPSGPTVTVIDVLPLRAQGTAVEARAGLPTVTLDEAGRPTLVPVADPPPADLVAQPLLRGTGPQVAADDVVTVQYAGFAWNGEGFDTTWETREPVSFALADVPSWQAGLTEQTVGSQVLLVVPPSYPLGVTTEGARLAGQTVVFVVDVLAARPVGGLPAAQAAPTAGATAGATS